MPWKFIRRWWFAGFFLLLAWMFWPLVPEWYYEQLMGVEVPYRFQDVGYFFLMTFFMSLMPLFGWIVLGITSLFND